MICFIRLLYINLLSHSVLRLRSREYRFTRMNCSVVFGVVADDSWYCCSPFKREQIDQKCFKREGSFDGRFDLAPWLVRHRGCGLQYFPIRRLDGTQSRFKMGGDKIPFDLIPKDLPFKENKSIRNVLSRTIHLTGGFDLAPWLIRHRGWGRNFTFKVNFLSQKWTEIFQKKNSFKNINLGDHFL